MKYNKKKIGKSYSEVGLHGSAHLSLVCADYSFSSSLRCTLLLRPGRNAKYCDLHVCTLVCLSVCPLAYLNMYCYGRVSQPTAHWIPSIYF